MEDTEPNQPSKVIRQGIKWRDWDTKPATKTFDLSLSCQECPGIGAWQNHYQRPEKLHPQLMGADAEFHSQTLGRMWGVLQKRNRKDGRNQWGERTP